MSDDVFSCLYVCNEIKYIIMFVRVCVVCVCSCVTNKYGSIVKVKYFTRINLDISEILRTKISSFWPIFRVSISAPSSKYLQPSDILRSLD